MFFDVDDTLCDFAAMMARALEQTAVELRRRFPALGEAGLTGPDLQRLRDEAAASSGPDGTLTELRRRGFAKALAPVTDDQGMAEQVTGYYLRCRYAASVVFDDVVPTLRTLRARGLRLGVLTNGNSGLESLRLHALFDLELVAENIGVVKPDPEAYRYASHRIQCAPSELVMVGDSWAHDVAGARAAGWRAILLDRSGTAEDTAAIRSLRELPSRV